VVVENTMRHVEEGMAPLQAAIAGAREVGFTILSITLSLVMVFVPIIFMPGVVGRLFHEFGVTISVAILWSGLVSLTLTPLLCATFLKAETPGRRENFVIAGFDVLFGAMTDFYRVTLDIALRFKGMVMLAMLATILATGALLAISPKGFFPTEDTGFIIAVTDARDDVSYPAVLSEHQHLADVLRKHPAVRSVTFVVGLNDINGSLTTGKLFVELKDKSERAPILKVVQELRSLSLQAPGLLAYYQPVQSLQSGAKSSKAKYMVSLLGSDLYAVEQGATRMLANLQKYPELQDVSQDIEDTVPRIKFTPNLQRLADLGIAPDQVRQTLYLALAGARVDSIYTSTSSYSVILELLPEQRAFPEQLGRIHIKTASGKLVPLSVLGSIEETRGPSAVAHTGGLPSITLSFNTAPGVTLDKALGLVKKAEEDAHLDSSVSAQLGGDAANFAQGQSGQALLLVAALFAIYVILGILYESFIHPITILAGLPSAALGAVLALLIFGMQLDVISMIGILMLIGIVKKNAIMMVDFALERYREGVTDPHQAIRDACLTRFRPIMMTTFAAIVGALPIAAGLGAGAELRQPLGVAVVGGLLFSQLVTLYLTPVIFIYLDKLSRRKPVEQGAA
jgi:hydrophobic/amphiphilic exporter-1 (mainly G- bacteria), HAE1 family